MPTYPDNKAATGSRKKASSAPQDPKMEATHDSSLPADAISGPERDAPASFEAALQELDEVVTKLEAGNVPLEESLALVQRGHELAARCDKTLGRAESILEQLTLSTDGELVARRLEWVDEDEEDELEDEDDAEA